jgi:Transcription initiation factor IID, 18kD subunit
MSSKKDQDATRDDDNGKEEEEQGTGNNRVPRLDAEIESMMYGFGDEKRVNQKTLALVNALTVDYIQSVTVKAVECGAPKGRLREEDLLFVVRHDRKKRARAVELMQRWQDLKRARQLTDHIDKPGYRIVPEFLVQD